MIKLEIKMLRRTTGLVIATCSLIASTTQGTAQPFDTSEGWSAQATLYGWLPVISGAQQGLDGEPVLDLKQDDILSRLDMAFMGTAELRRDKWGLLADLVYIDLSHDADWLGNRLTISTETKVKMVTLAAAYRWHEDARSSADIYAGARYFDVDMDFGSATDLRERESDAQISWTDGIIGLRGETKLNERWSFRSFLDVGGFDSSSDLSWQVYGGGNYAISENWDAAFGYRYLSIVKEGDRNAKLDIDVHGPVIGIAYKF
ncbi:outer membrane beta-barrel protein [Paracoccus sp. MBLB3053]|uniref:Outer membrane beta-barrel protein n=1 Tax=Paracoccus aurantius TaxID=3073814 RepID=A0ABU2HX68_9RHOB|nr:outer membrane beta-barrel protein [Paracoccus sp. MBLB3053]MDS9469628.1 outer membrane beta-barrel protein [Paracoccus sp. MBLB3053]